MKFYIIKPQDTSKIDKLLSLLMELNYQSYTRDDENEYYIIDTEKREISSKLTAPPTEKQYYIDTVAEFLLLLKKLFATVKY